jgi:gliding motility-associated-like protein
MKATKVLLSITFSFFLSLMNASAQICGVSGFDGPTNASTIINTYYPPSQNTSLATGANSVKLLAVPATDQYGNSFGTVPISAGDLLIIIQIQDGAINTSNSSSYGSGTNSSGPDGLGGTGFTSLGNAGKYEYLIALNNVSLAGGTLQFRGANTSQGLINNYVNSLGNGSTTGQKTFQVIRVPQFSSLTLARNISAPPFNGSVGGIIAFDVAGDFNFNGFTIDASGRGFRGGFQSVQVSNCTISNTYATATDILASGKGESIAGTPRYMWDGYNEVNNGANWQGFPGYYFGRGAPANAGGGGNDHNSGGGGGGNGGHGGVGGLAWQGAGACNGDPGNPSGGRPGSRIQTSGPDKIYLGGGGGGGDANNATTGTKGGVGGGIILINAGRITGTGTIKANGGNGDRGAYLNNPDGAGGGGAGGTIVLRVLNSSSAQLNLVAIGGSGGNTANDRNNEHGPGGGGGGGEIWHSIPQATINTDVRAGSNGVTNDAGTDAIAHGAASGQSGSASSFNTNTLPIYLLGMGASCYPTLTITKSELNPGVPGSRTSGNTAQYFITVQNVNLGGGAGGVRISDQLPSGFNFVSCTAVYSGGASGPATPTNYGISNNLELGQFTMPPGGSLTLTINVFINLSVPIGIYHNGAQVQYLDPTRTLASPIRRITPLINSLSGQNTTYQSGVNSGVTVPGQNYDGQSTGPSDEDVHIIAPGSIETSISICAGGDAQLSVTPPKLTPPFSYQWSGPGNFSPSATVQSPIINNVQSINAGTYTVVITDAKGFISTYSTTLSVSLGQPISIQPISSVICSQEQFNITPNAATPGNIIPPGTTYTWTVAPNANVSGQYDQPLGQPIISQTLINLTNSVQTVLYTLTPSGGICNSLTFTATITVNPRPTLPNQSIEICSEGSFSTTPTNIPPNTIIPAGTTYAWLTPVTSGNISGAITGSGIFISGKLINQTNSAQTATYTVTPTGGINGNCVGTNFTVLVTVNPLPTVTVNSPSTCAGVSTTVTATPGSGVAGDYNYAWTVPGGVVSPGNVQSVTSSIAGTYSVIITNKTTGCVSTSASGIVTVNPLPTVIVNSPSTCAGIAATVTATPGSGAAGDYTYVWSVPASAAAPGSVSTFTTTIVGVYSVIITKTSTGCVSTSASGTVSNTALPTLTVNSSTVCAGANATVTATPGSGAISDYTYAWTIPVGASAPGSVSTFKITTAGVYSVVITKTATGCVSTSASGTVTVNPKPIVSISSPSPAVICEGLGTSLTASGGVSYKWYLNDVEIIGANLSTLNAITPGSYTVVAISSSGCISDISSQIVLTLIKKPTADFRFTGYCKYITTRFENLSNSSLSGAVNWSWKFGDNSISNSFEPTHTYLNAGTYMATLTVTSQNCSLLSSSVTKTISIDSPRLAIRYPSKNLIQNSPTTLEARKLGTTYKWLPARGLNDYNIYNPIFNFNQETEYKIEITAQSGCIIIDTQLVRIFSQADIKVPNAFSPNDDGHNDMLDIFLIGIDKLIFFRVFNRWGQLMFETKDPSQRWDGRFKGIKQPLETYVWIAEAITSGGSKIVRRGQSILLR